MHRKRSLSDTHEMYLKTVLQVRGTHQVARLRDVAEGLGLTPGTVSSVVKKLDEMHLVEHDRYGFVTLSPAGESVATCVMRRFETVRDLLVEVLGVDSKTAEQDACAMEHAVSPVTANRMRAFLERERVKRAKKSAAGARRKLPDPCARCEALGTCQAAAAV